jgi:plasmid replication initiation protein
MTEQFDLDFVLDLDSPLCGNAKNERTLMVYNWFALSREKQTELPIYDDGKACIEVKGTSYGVANIWDKELFIYLASLMQDRINRGETVGRSFQFTAHDYFRITGTKPNGSAYNRLEESLVRLKSTTIRTNLLDNDGRGGRMEAFSWLDSVSFKWRQNRGGEKIMQAIRVEMGERLFNAILKNKRMLTYDAAYFQLSPLEKRLYEIARAHCGQQRGFKMNIEKLRLRIGTQNDLRRFKAELVKISKRKNQLPGYGLMLNDPRVARSLDAKVPPPAGRTPLKSYMVFFFRTDRLSLMPSVHDVPVIDEDDGLPASDDFGVLSNAITA